MFINESINIKNSALFYSIMRNVLIEQVSEKNDEKMVSFIEKLSDHNIISLATIGKMAVDEDSKLHELFVMNIIKEAVIENSEIFESINDYSALDFINEIGVMNHDSNEVLSELMIPGYPGGGLNDPAFREKINNFMQDIGVHLHTGGYDLFSASRAAANKFGDWEQDFADKITGNDGVVRSATKGIYRTARDVAIGFQDFVMHAKDTLTTNNVYHVIEKFTKEHHVAIGNAALIAVATYLSVEVYKKYFSKAVTACKGKSGSEAEKKACIEKYNKEAKKAAAASLKKNLSLSKKAVNPQKYSKSIKKLISKLS